MEQSHMKRILLLSLVLALGIAILTAQEGENYRGLKQVVEKEYLINQNFGQNKMKLSQVKTGFYNDRGALQNWILEQGNRSFLGQVKILSSQDAKERETLYYDYMNRLTGRRYEQQGPQDNEITMIEYDAKGKLLNKKRSRYFAVGDEKWDFEYNQVGYLTHYSQAPLASNSLVSQEYEYDYFDELNSIHHYLYTEDNAGALKEIRSEDPEGKLQKRLEYIYNEQGLLLEEKSFEGEDAPLGGIRYTYDDRQRLIQKLEYRYNPRYGGVYQTTKQCDYSYF